jgi:DNA-binding NtrC family response regulator
MRSNYHLAPDALQKLKSYQYPGNVRELRNVLFIAATRSHDGQINTALIESVLNNLPHCATPQSADDNALNLSVSVAPIEAVSKNVHSHNDDLVTLKDIEAQHIKDLLDQYQGNRKKAADALGISERTIYRKLKDLGIS